MPRKAGIDAPGALHHVIVRGIERRLETVRVRSLARYFAVEEPGLTQSEISLKSGMTQAAVSIAIRRGSQFAR